MDFQRTLSVKEFPVIRRFTTAVLVAALLAACGGQERSRSDERTPPTAAASEETRAPAAVDSVETAPPTDQWVVTPRGAGPVRIGMELSELAPHLASSVDTGSVDPFCDYVAMAEAPDSLGFMVVDRRLVRIDVWGGATPTGEGARIGDSEARILSLYGRVERQPHKYTDGHYLVVMPLAPSDTLHRYVFETDGERVTQYRAGVHPQVALVEGCS